MSVPELDPEQRRAALDKAVAARRVRAELKQMLKSGEVTLREVLERADADDVLARTRVQELLEALPGVGRVRAERTMQEVEIAPSRRLGGLGPRQRAALLERFGQ